MEEIADWIKLVVAAVLLGGCYLTSFILISKFIGSADKWGQINDKSPMIWVMSMLGSVALFASALLYFSGNPEKIMYFIFTITFLAVGLSYSALSIALIHK